MIYGLITLLLMIVFVGIVVWAWSGKRRRTYEKAARLPLEEEEGKRNKQDEERS